jgi:hypothetical protein
MVSWATASWSPSNEGEPWFPLVGRRLLNGDGSIPLRLTIFDVLRVDGEDPHRTAVSREKGASPLARPQRSYWTTTELFDDGQALYTSVCERGLERVARAAGSARA